VTTWIRRNAVALVAVVVLAPATIAITFASEWGSYFQSRASQPITVAADESATFAGTQWRINNTRRIPASSAEGLEAGLPSGSDLVVVTVEVRPGDLTDDGQSPFCVVRLDELDGTRVARTWNDAIFSAIQYRGGSDVESSCVSDLVDPYRFEAIFVVPDDTDGDLALQLEVTAELPQYLHLRL